MASPGQTQLAEAPARAPATTLIEGLFGPGTEVVNDVVVEVGPTQQVLHTQEQPSSPAA